jgi:N-succinyldiaminopimelate aminotransferase
VTLRAPDFRVDVDALQAAVTPRTRMLLINAPHNPTGMVLTDAERSAIRDVAVEHDLVVVADEVYEHLVFDGIAHVPLASLDGMAERTITIGSAGKTFSYTGWKIGWAIAPAALIDAVRTTKQFLTYVSGGPFQYAVAEGLDLPDEYFATFTADLQHKRDVLSDGLRSVGFEVMPSAGTYFVTTDIRPLGFDDGLEFCRALPERAGVVAIPHQVFYDDVDAGRPLVRWAFCKQVPVLEAAIDRLGALSRS